MNKKLSAEELIKIDEQVNKIYENSSEILRTLIRETYVRPKEATKNATSELINSSHMTRQEFETCRKFYNLTYQDLADVSKLSKQTVSNYGLKTSKATEIYLSMILTIYARVNDLH